MEVVASEDPLVPLIPEESACAFDDVLLAIQDIVISFVPKLAGSYSALAYEIVLTPTVQHFRALKSFISTDKRPPAVKTALRCLRVFPPEAVSRQDRESLIDSLTSYIIEKLAETPEKLAILSDLIDVCTRFLRASSPTAQICSDAKIFQALEEGLSFSLSCDYLALAQTRALFNAVFEQVLTEPDLPRNRDFAAAMCEFFHDRIELQILVYTYFEDRPYSLLAMIIWMSKAGDLDTYSETRELKKFYCEKFSHRSGLAIVDTAAMHVKSVLHRSSPISSFVDSLLIEGYKLFTLSRFPGEDMFEKRLFELNPVDAVTLYEAVCGRFLAPDHLIFIERFYEQLDVSKLFLRAIAATHKGILTLRLSYRALVFEEGLLDSKRTVTAWARLQLQADFLRTFECMSIPHRLYMSYG